MSYNVVFLYIKDFWLNFIFETLDDKKNNQKIDQKHKRRFQVSQFLSENSNSLIVGTSVKFWSKIYNILRYIKKYFFKFRWLIKKIIKKSGFLNFYQKIFKILWNLGGIFNEKFEKQSIETFLKKIAKF